MVGRKMYINIGIVTYNKNPYRDKQFKEFTNMDKANFNIYYCKNIDRNWNVEEIVGVNEKKLTPLIDSKNIGVMNLGLLKIVKENDVIVIGGYDQPTYIYLSLLCKIFKKPYIIMYDGISVNKIEQNKLSMKYKIKELVIKDSTAIFGSGEVSRRFYKENFNVSDNDIYNQYLTVDINEIIKNNDSSNKFRIELRNKYNIDLGKKVIFYSGRIIALKNILKIIEAISLIENKDEYILFIAGGGEDESRVKEYAKNNNVDLIITGFISEQHILFKHYYIADIFILASLDEVWGLVVNEAMAAKLPILVSNRCGCSLDFVKDNINGYKFNPEDSRELCDKIKKIFNKDLEKMGQESYEIIKYWTFENSRKQLQKILFDKKIISKQD